MTDLRKYCGRYSTVLALLVGGLFALLMWLAAATVMTYRYVDEAAQRQDINLATIASVAEQSQRIARELIQSHQAVCDTANLSRLGALLFKYRYVRDIGLFDDERRLFCMVSQGRLHEPVTLPPTPFVHKLRGPLWFGWSPPFSGDKPKTVASGYGNFLIIHEPTITREMLASADVVWFDPVETPSHVRDGLPDAWMQALASQRPKAGAGWQFHWRSGTFVSVAKVPGSKVVLGDVYPLKRVFAEHPDLTWLFTVMSVVLGAAVAFSARPRFQRAGQLRKRLKSLFDVEHIRCVYQPIVDLKTGQPIGCEVLVRMLDDGKLMMPDTFIPAVQAEGLGQALDATVIKVALSEIQAVASQFRGMKVAFNFFPESISYAFVSGLIGPHRNWLAKNGIRVDVEVTEYHFSDQLIPELRRIEGDGFEISVDDFGTGYSNLNTVKKVAPHVLKIDKSFVYEMEDASIRSSLIPEIIGIANAVSATLVAEGIENQSQAERLQLMGVQCGQGYYFGRPMPLQEFLALVEAWQPTPVQEPAEADG